jgi:hypothetical protein
VSNFLFQQHSYFAEVYIADEVFIAGFKIKVFSTENNLNINKLFAENSVINTKISAKYAFLMK